MKMNESTKVVSRVRTACTAVGLGVLLGVIPAAALQEGGTPSEAAEPAPENNGLPEEDPVADFYVARCAGCHTVGGGELTAPDLLPSTGWPEADLTLAVERMEKNVGDLSREQVDDLVDFLKGPEVQARIAAARERQVAEMAATLEPPSPRTGRDLFHGEEPFARGGMPCAACHRAGEHGGNLAANLTDAYARLGESALLSASESPGFPLMKAAYEDHPVSRQEAVHLVAYLERVSPEKPSDEDGETEGAGAAGGPPVGTWGTALAALVLVTLAFPLARSRSRRRLAGRGVRAELVKKSRRS